MNIPPLDPIAEPRHGALIDAFFDAIGRGDIATQCAMLTPDFVLYEPPGLPYSGRYDGAEGWQAFLKALPAALGGIRIKRIGLIAEGPDSAILAMHLSARLRTTGQPIDTDILEAYRFRDGKIAEIRPWLWNTAQFAPVVQA